MGLLAGGAAVGAAVLMKNKKQGHGSAAPAGAAAYRPSSVPVSAVRPPQQYAGRPPMRGGRGGMRGGMGRQQGGMRPGMAAAGGAGVGAAAGAGGMYYYQGQQQQGGAGGAGGYYDESGTWVAYSETSTTQGYYTESGEYGESQPSCTQRNQPHYEDEHG